MKESDGVTTRIAEFVACASLEDVPAQAVERAKKHIADSIATMIAGTFSDLAPVLRSYVGQAAPGGQTPVIGWGDRTTSELAAFILPRALITIRKDDGLDIGKVADRWDASPDLAGYGVGYLVHGLLDYIVDGHFEAVQSLDDAVEGLEDDLFAPPSRAQISVQRRSFELRKSLVLLRRVVLPMREVLNTVMRRDLRHVNDDLMPYFQDVYDHVLRAAEWTESLRDLVTTILETNLTIQGNRMNIITKKVTSWAAIIAVPTFITGFYGMNVPYPGFSNHVGFAVATVIMLGSGVLLYWVFRRNDWL